VRRGARLRAPALATALLLLLSTCRASDQAEPPSASPDARPEVVETLRADLRAERHPADGGGRAWIEDAPTPPVMAGATGRFTILYEAGPLGIQPGGMLLFQVSPFWGWSTPQVTDPQGLGFTEVTGPENDLRLEPRTLAQQLLGIRVAGRALAEGERVLIVYGAGPAGARVDRYAERHSTFWIAVDGDGDGVRGLLPECPTVDVGPGPAAQLVVTLPTTARPGDHLHATLAVLDGAGNAGVPLEGRLRLRSEPPGLELPQEVVLRSADRGQTAVVARAPLAGVFRIEVSGPDGMSAESNPLVVDPQIRRVLWGDLHGHSQVSDGTGTPEDYFSYARDVAGLDVAALTDHDHWGMRPLARTPELWQEIERQVRAFHEPDRFVTLLGYEWTSWVHGHRHVLFFGDEGRVWSSLDPAFEEPRQLWEALRGQPALTVAHHSAGGPIATDWSSPPDPELEPVTEIVSVHGSSEAPDSPVPIYHPVAGNYVRDALGNGYRLGFVGSGDSHDGHPGLAHLGGPSGGLAAILSETLTRDGVLRALRARRVYATNGRRIYLEATLAGQEMGAEISQRSLVKSQAELRVRLIAAGPLRRLDVVRSGKVALSIDGAGESELSIERRLLGLTAGEYVYVRAVQEDDGTAWSSPFFVME
jgi:hypothetical protein